MREVIEQFASYNTDLPIIAEEHIELGSTMDIEDVMNLVRYVTLLDVSQVVKTCSDRAFHIHKLVKRLKKNPNRILVMNVADVKYCKENIFINPDYIVYTNSDIEVPFLYDKKNVTVNNLTIKDDCVSFKVGCKA